MTGYDHIIRTGIDADRIAPVTIDQRGRAANVIDQAMPDALGAFVERVLGDDSIRGAPYTSKTGHPAGKISATGAICERAGAPALTLGGAGSPAYRALTGD